MPEEMTVNQKIAKLVELGARVVVLVSDVEGEVTAKSPDGILYVKQFGTEAIVMVDYAAQDVVMVKCPKWEKTIYVLPEGHPGIPDVQPGGVLRNQSPGRRRKRRTP